MSTIARTKVWVTGDVLTAADLNGEFNTIYNDYNGSIDHNNLGTIAGTVTHTVSSNIDLWDLTKTGSGAGGIWDVSDAGTGVTMDIDKTGDGEVINITANNNTGDVVDINSSNSSAILQRLNAASAAVAQVVGDGTDNYAQIGGDGVIDFAGARVPGWFCNLGIVNATTSEANDSIKIQGATAALSQTNRLHITMPDEDTIGQLKMLTATADVTINLTGAHWGLGTLGDFTDVELRVYAINDNGTLKWGVSLTGGYRTITTALSSTTATDINLKTEMLVNSAISASPAPCLEVGWFHGNFDDTSGASEDLWAVQTSVGDINVGIPVPDQTDWQSYTPTSSMTNLTDIDGRWRRDGENMHVEARLIISGTTSGTASFSLPSGYLIDDSKLSDSTASNGTSAIGLARYGDNTSNSYVGIVERQSTSAVRISGNATTGNWSATVPVTIGNTDGIAVSFTAPIVKWSSNRN